MHQLSSRKKSKLSAQGKAIAAARVMFDTVEGRIDERTAGRWLREEVGLQWSFLTCLQYLCGQEALAAIEALPDNWSDHQLTKRRLQAAAVLAAHAVANFRPDGTMLCASYLASELKNKTFERRWAETFGVDRADF